MVRLVTEGVGRELVEKGPGAALTRYHENAKRISGEHKPREFHPVRELAKAVIEGIPVIGPVVGTIDFAREVLGSVF